jgi:tetratricopeptide (TPR) repeat protein
MRKRHLTEDEISGLFANPARAEPTEKRARQMEHISDCRACSDRFDEYSKFVSVLSHAAVWVPGKQQTPIDTRKVERIIALMRQLAEERTDVAPLLDQTLTGSRATWMSKLVLLGNIHTHGMVDALLDRAVRVYRHNPADGLELTSIAVEIADQISVDAYAFDFVIALRARACREHAFSLYFSGRIPEALPFVERAEKLFRQTPRPEFDLARVAVVRALIYRDTGRMDDALPLTHDAAETFLFYGDKIRCINTKMTEGTMLFRQRRFAEALPIYSELENEPAVTQMSTYGMLLQHLGSCYREAGEFDHARRYYERAIVEHEKHNAISDILHVQWSLGLTLLAEQKQREALPVLRQAWRGLTDLQIPADGALAGLKLAETLLMLDEPAEVPAICRTILDEFTRAGMMTPAVSALSFLREAVAMDKGTATTIALVRHVHDFLQDLPKHPARTFTPPPL